MSEGKEESKQLERGMRECEGMHVREDLWCHVCRRPNAVAVQVMVAVQGQAKVGDDNVGIVSGGGVEDVLWFEVSVDNVNAVQALQGCNEGLGQQRCRVLREVAFGDNAVIQLAACWSSLFVGELLGDAQSHGVAAQWWHLSTVT